MENIKGTGVALVTPFKDNFEVDYEALKRLLTHVINGKVEYLVVLGTTAEAATLTKEEKDKVVEFVISNSEGLPIVIGIGGNNTQEVINNIKTFKHIDQVVGILSVVPYYSKPSQEGIYQHYKAIVSSTDKPIILYNVPGRTGVNMTAETCLRLANEFNTIVAVKEASGDINQVTKIVKDKPKDFVVLSGDDGITLPLISIGVEGVISVVANAFPKDFSEMIRLSRKGEFKKANEHNYKLNEIIDSLFEDGNPGGVKAYLEYMGVIDNYLRLPLVPVNKNLYKKIGTLLERY